jgi:hypothetical protein
LHELITLTPFEASAGSGGPRPPDPSALQFLVWSGAGFRVKVKLNQQMARIKGKRSGAMESNISINWMMLAILAVTISVLFKRFAK